MSNPLCELAKVGQSVWFDQMERKLVTSGHLQQMIDQDDLRGLTSNPTIFEKAIAGSEDYDAQLRELAAQDKSRDEIYDELVLRDIASAADVFRPVFDKNGGNDGFVSIEVLPTIARDTNATIAEAKRLSSRLNRPNVMVKIPATPEGIPAIEESLAAGVNINITLIFSNDVYKQVMEAYVRALERRVEQNLPIDHLNSVASFFVSRIDTQADKQLEAKAKDDPSLEPLLGKIAISNAKLAYQEFRRVFSGDRWERLRAKGGKVQRPLWASTGTKNPKYSDVRAHGQHRSARDLRRIQRSRQGAAHARTGRRRSAARHRHVPRQRLQPEVDHRQVDRRRREVVLRILRVADDDHRGAARRRPPRPRRSRHVPPR
jgi:transaldolase